MRILNRLKAAFPSSETKPAAPACSDQALHQTPVPNRSSSPSPRLPIEHDLSALARSADLSALVSISPRIFFIAAHPRSGTNWLSSLLNQHPFIACTGEFTFHDVLGAVNSITTSPGRAASREPAKSHTLLAFQTFIRDSMRSIAHTVRDSSNKPPISWVGDHTPRRLRVFLPEAAYIVLVRDVRDVVVSWTFNALARREDWVVPDLLKPLFSTLVTDFHTPSPDSTQHQLNIAAHLLKKETWIRHVARQWASHIRDDLDAIDRIRASEIFVLDNKVKLLRYEDLHARTAQQRDDLFRFLNLDPAQAQPIEQGRRTTPGFADEDPASHYRKGQVGDWKSKLSPQAVQWILDESGTELAKLGYEASR